MKFLYLVASLLILSLNAYNENDLKLFANTGKCPEGDLKFAKLTATINGLRGRGFHEIDLHSADLMGADLSEANLENANLEGANLTLANCKRANLANAILLNVKANLTNFSEANFHYSSRREPITPNRRRSTNSFTKLQFIKSEIIGTSL